MENSMGDPQKIKNRTNLWSSSSTFGIYPNKSKTLTQKDICTSTFTAALFTIVKIWKQPIYPSMDEWIKKISHTHRRILFSHKKEWNLAIWDNMDGPWGHSAKWNQFDRERQILNDFIYIWNLKNNNNNL